MGETKSMYSILGTFLTMLLQVKYRCFVKINYMNNCQKCQKFLELLSLNDTITYDLELHL